MAAQQREPHGAYLRGEHTADDRRIGVHEAAGLLLALGFEDTDAERAADVEVRCRTCDDKRRMAEAFGREAVGSLPGCRGRRPHLRDFEVEPCKTALRAILLGASNSWFGVTLSTLYVPTPPKIDLVRGATRRILLITYAAYRLPGVLSALRDALDRGVRLELLFETRADSDDRISFDPVAAMGDLAARATIYRWPRERREPDEDGHRGLLHAKAVLVDDRRLLISSANFTEAAMLLNIELGVLLEGGELPPALARHFEGLVGAGVIRQ
ncbi:MAG: hypothetical protein IT373_13940 [Polyangiaceae bacterium]|nr:hypothetical protein [Polyangiaceae bacterium]